MASPLVTAGGLKMIAGDDKMRAERCLQNVKMILEQYDCELHPIVILV